MDTLGEVIVCGALTDGVLLPQKQLRGKKIRNICGGFDHLAVLFDNYAIEWITEMVRFSGNMSSPTVARI